MLHYCSSDIQSSLESRMIVNGPSLTSEAFRSSMEKIIALHSLPAHHLLYTASAQRRLTKESGRSVSPSLLKTLSDCFRQQLRWQNRMGGWVERTLALSAAAFAFLSWPVKTGILTATSTPIIATTINNSARVTRVSSLCRVFLSYSDISTA